MYSERNPVLFLFVFAILNLAACIREEPIILADCFWSARAVAFIDENENGILDEGESPLGGVEFVLEPTVYSRATSGPDGIASIFATIPAAGADTSCEEIRAENLLQVAAVNFEGYEMTSAQSIAYTDDEAEYHFGFVPVKAEATDTTPPTDDSRLVNSENGYELVSTWPVSQVNYLFEWYGENIPVWEYEQITVRDGRFIHGNSTDVTTEIEQLLTSVHGFSPVDEVVWTNLWTDDYPEWYVEIVGQDGRSILLFSESTGFRGHAPWYAQIDGQIYRQTNGDLGFALFNLVSDKAKNYFSLDEQPFDENLIEPGGRPYIYAKQTNFTGLLPIAKTFEYVLSNSANVLTGRFYWDNDISEYDTSSQPLIGIEAIQFIRPNGEAQSCTFENAQDPEFESFTLYTFHCSYPSEMVKTGSIRITFTTSAGIPLVLKGNLLTAH